MSIINQKKPVKIVLKGLKVVIVLSIVFFFFMILPRLYSIFLPQKPPVGYFAKYPVYLAILTGLEKVIDKTPPIPEGVKEIKDIEYKNIDGKSMQLDLYLPENSDQPVPLLVFVHGGGWKSGKRSDYLVYLVAFAKKGFATASVSYRLRNDALYPACADDVTDAIRWLADNGRQYHYDPSRMALIGGSAGGHLVMLAAYGWQESGTLANTDTLIQNNWKIKAVVNFYGPCDLTTDFAKTHPLVTGLLGNTYNETPELFRQASPLTWLDKNDPPTLIFHGTCDQTVPVSQSDTLYRRLQHLGVQSEYKRLPGWPHTMDLVQRVNTFSQSKMEKFFERYLK
jgi:acetyl esterase/lipase